MENQDNKLQEDTLLFQHYLIIFLDILGQRRSLRNIRDLPTNETDKADFIRALKETIGKVDALRTLFHTFFVEAKSYQPDISHVPAQYQQEFISCQQSEAYFYGFSDSIIIAVPLGSNDENCTAINGVYSAFIAASGISLMALSGKTALRGGLDVGIATQIKDKEIYGPALERAYYLESNFAEYPRLVVGKELMSYLHGVENQQTRSRSGEVAKSIARFCREMIIQDTDGFPILDFMGKNAKEVSDNSVDSDLVKKAGDFVESQYKKYSSEENHKLSSRYFRLLRYFKWRAKLWGI
ncbi:MAG: hypothetical protein ABIK91_06530 [Pseudomonadota bacterium]